MSNYFKIEQLKELKENMHSERYLPGSVELLIEMLVDDLIQRLEEDDEETLALDLIEKLAQEIKY